MSKLPNPYSEHVLNTHEQQKAKHAPAQPTSDADKVRLFHYVAGIDFPTRPGFIPEADYTLAKNLIEEEIREWKIAHRTRDLVEVADAFADLLYVVYRAALAYGLPIHEIFDEVHRSNMTKFPGGVVLRRNDGKILKPESWEPPRIKEILDAHASES